MPKETFVAGLGPIYEHSPWVAERVADERPFTDAEHLAGRMRGIVDAAADAAKLALIRAHPDLAGKLARAGALAEASAREQAGAGLDRLSEEEYATFTDLNERYRQRFGFPFVICVRLTDKAGILTAFRQRLEHDPAAEIAAALEQIHHIARLRLEEVVG